MCWPCRVDLYGHHLDDARAAHALVARTIAEFEPVTMIASPADADAAGAATGPSVDIEAMPIDDSWFRDTGPIMVIEDGEVLATQWKFNAWGESYHPYDLDATIARRWAEAAGFTVDQRPMVLEGGSLAVDGAGMALTTEQCLLHPNRNPHLSRIDIEVELHAVLGIHHVVWLPHGLFDDHDTDGHVDNVAAFSPRGTVLLQGCDDPALPDYYRMQADRAILEEVGLSVVEVPVLPFDERYGRRVPVPYLNFYVGNGFVIVPVCGHDADADMCDLIAAQYPGRRLVPLDVGAILAVGGGGIHCITQQIPAGTSRE
jgi:agmatine deiminase